MIENDSTNNRNKKRFELVPNRQGQVDIIDYVESEEKGAICIYNDLGVFPFTSASALCDLLNELHDKCEFLEIENEALEDSATKYAELYHKSLKEIEQLKKELKRCKDWINSDKNDYELTLAFIKNKGYSLKDVLEYEKELKK